MFINCYLYLPGRYVHEDNERGWNYRNLGFCTLHSGTEHVIHLMIT